MDNSKDNAWTAKNNMHFKKKKKRRRWGGLKENQSEGKV